MSPFGSSTQCGEPVRMKGEQCARDIIKTWWIKKPFKLQDRMVGYNLIKHEKFIDMVSDSTCHILLLWKISIII